MPFDDPVEKVGGRSLVRLGRGLSVEARTVWAKYDARVSGWLPLWRHMADSGAVAGLLWDRWLPSGVRRQVAEALPGGESDARQLAVWLAGVHDIGKATPAFACQVDELADRMRDVGLEMAYRREMGQDRRMAPHGLAGQLLLQEWLEERCGWSGRATAQFAVVVGGHHGVPPDHAQVADLDAHPALLRAPGPSRRVWRRVQEELLEACADEFGVRERLAEWRRVRLPQPVQVLLSALVIVADWIASNSDLFPYAGLEQAFTGRRVAAAWQGLGLPEPWQPVLPRGSVAELFAARFALPVGARLRPVQEAAVRLARTMAEPGLLIVEAPMGEGKTEAALAAAEVLAARSGAGGVFFALPTMATSNAMFPRLLAWLDRLPSRDGERLSVLLAHSKAALNEGFAELKAASWQRIAAVDTDGGQELPRPGGEDRAAPAELVAHQWLGGRKKGMLSSFVAGTIDQLLFAGLKSRHLALRHLALAGKVVVIDEAHAYDTYMNAYLDRVLAWLGEYGVPVVVLSATLPAARRRELAQAYAGTSRTDSFAEVGEAAGYPLLTAVSPGHQPLLEEPGASGRCGEVQVEALADDLAVLADRLERALAGGGCALVVRNTVERVLETAKALRGRFGLSEVTVAHARFIDLDRAAKDRGLLERFGPPGITGGRRPGRHIVVASQVAEQSLDVDFDLLVTDLAPVDLLLQRMGRLHRHPRDGRPVRLREPLCLVAGVADWQSQPPEPVPGSRAVYGRHALLRSLAALELPGEGKRRTIGLPRDISPLVQHAYGGAPAGPASWACAMDQARREHEDLKAAKAKAADTFRIAEAATPGRSLAGWLAGGAGDADDTRAGRAQVRDAPESLEVIVVEQLGDGSLATVSWAGKGRGGLPLPTDAVPAPKAAKAAAACTLRLPIRMSQPHMIERVISELEQFCVPIWQTKQSIWLSGELILPIRRDCQTSVAGFRLSYSPDDGLEVTDER